MANIPQIGFIGPTGNQLQDSQANRRASLLQNLGQIIIQNRKLEEEQRQYNTNKTFEIGLDVLENQYKGNWAEAIENNDPTIKSMFAIYGDEGLEMFDKLKASGGMGQSASQITERGAKYRVSNLDQFQDQNQGQAQQQNQGQGAAPGDLKAQFASFIQDLSEASGINPPSTEESPSQGQESQNKETSNTSMNLDNIPSEYLKPVPVTPPAASATTGSNVLGGSNFVRPSARTRTTEYSEPGVGNAAGEEGQRDIRRKEVPVDPTKEGGRYAGEGYGKPLDREEMLRRANAKEAQFFEGYNELSEPEREVVAQVFEKTGMVPKSKEAVQKILQEQEEQKGMEAVKTVAESAQATPEEVVKTAEAVGESEESFVKAALIDPKSVSTIVEKYNTLAPSQFNDFIKSTNLPEGTQGAIIKAATESYRSLNPKEKVLYGKATNSAAKNMANANRPGKLGNPELAEALKGSQKVYARVAMELGKGLENMDPAVLASLTPDQRSGFQLKEAAGQFDETMKLERDKFEALKDAQAAGIAMDWLKYNTTKKAMEEGGEQKTLTKETVEVFKVLQQDVEKELAPLYEKYGDDPEKLKGAIEKKLGIDARFKDNFETYKKMGADILGVPIAKITSSVESGMWLWKSETPVDYSAISGIGTSPTVNFGGGNPGAETDLSDEYSR